jgi:hypothetical protein
MEHGTDAVSRTAEWARSGEQGADKFAAAAKQANHNVGFVLYLAGRILETDEPFQWASVFCRMMGDSYMGSAKKPEDVERQFILGASVERAVERETAR